MACCDDNVEMKPGILTVAVSDLIFFSRAALADSAALRRPGYDAAVLSQAQILGDEVTVSRAHLAACKARFPLLQPPVTPSA